MDVFQSVGKLSEYLGLPVNSSEHGYIIDYMIGWVHWLMLVLFIGWGAFYIYCIIRFASRNNKKASYHGVTSNYSTYAEAGVILFEAFLLIAFAVPLWSMFKTDLPDEHNAVRVRVIAQQFQWNIHYPGKDGIWGPLDPEYIDGENPIGLIREEDGPGADDIVVINDLHLPVNKETIIYLTSMDVIHSFALPEMRVKQDAIPGQEIPVFFTPKMTSEEFLKKIEGTSREGMGYEIACAQLCGNSHYKMRGFMTIESESEYNNWLEEQADEIEIW
ncbi:MAG: hypothetical protein CBD58_03045 [bacterium TMED198]|nr:MAG: hypothetical protein CBD58_03045 [bacterium TMED198]|tara:strand:- start:1198 stop:2019 length:822 start_codon:yes stop_codon:yes gene_type:complete